MELRVTSVFLATTVVITIILIRLKSLPESPQIESSSRNISFTSNDYLLSLQSWSATLKSSLHILDV